jgi:hypothetical protein
VRLFQDGVEHGRGIARRRIDDLQYLGGRGLLLQGFVPLGEGLIPLGSALDKLTL